MNKIHHYGFFKVATAIPAIKVGDVSYNKAEIISLIEKAAKEEVSLLAFPELCLTGSTCGDLFSQKILIRSAKEALLTIADYSKEYSFPILVGTPFSHRNRLYNCVAVIIEGKIRAMIPKQLLTAEESRYFSTLSLDEWEYLELQEETNTHFSNFVSYYDAATENFTFTVEIGEDSKAFLSASSTNYFTKVNLIVNPCALPAGIGYLEKKKNELKALSSKNKNIYLHVNAGFGESTTEHVYAGQSYILEDGKILAEGKTFHSKSSLLVSLVDLDKVESLKSAPIGTLRSSREESRLCKFFSEDSIHWYHDEPARIPESEKKVLSPLIAKYPKFPFIPDDAVLLERNCCDIIDIICQALEKRFHHIQNKTSVLGVSGGLDSTLALLLLVEAYRRMGKPLTEIVGVRMPGFGTSGETYQNSCKLMDLLGITSREVDIKASVIQHLKDIEHPLEQHDVTYENAQARERTQILMDIANQTNGLVIGTGDLSELALGFCSYNGDHMSMYSVNASIPKTLIPYVIRSLGRKYSNPEILKVLESVIDTPISPELLPPNANEKIMQKTEELIGPYALHDFFLYYMLRYGFTPSKIRALATAAFENAFSYDEINRWINVFYRRFFTHQFKRNCLPDSPILGSISVFGEFHMPSDAIVSLWLTDLEEDDA